MFAYNKNYEEFNKIPPTMKKGSNTENMDSDFSTNRVFTLEFVIKKFNEYGEENSASSIRVIANWKLKTTENVLRALLKNGMDKIAWYLFQFVYFY